MKKVNVGIVGCGNISGIYLTNLTGMFSKVVNVVAVCDIIPERALEAQKKYGIPKAYFTDGEIMADDEIEFILNITTPDQHCPVNMMALEAGKHAYCEKPLAICREDGEKQVALAKEKGLMLGGAPDTFMGGGIQTCRKLIDDGWIGDVVAVNASMRCRGHESWHPGPEFYYKAGGGPMFDMGPYYLTALANLAGPAESVMAFTRITFPQRLITSQPLCGTLIDVDVPTHIAGLIRFRNGAIGTLTTSFDVYDDHQACIEIFGSRGSIQVPDPNGFGGPVRMMTSAGGGYQDVPVVFGYCENSRGIGVADMCLAIREGRQARANYTQTFHVLDMMCAFHESSDLGREVKLAGGFGRQDALKPGCSFG
ncbi:MAG: Gfo/Idh/MocA family oxidoreductase [Clostridia bacterium]|nr:Gfo/Idh/MocA family oxidoreductase [Clostridia bacterium]